MSYKDDISLGFNFDDDDRVDAELDSADEGAQEEDLADAESNADEDEDVCMRLISRLYKY